MQRFCIVTVVIINIFPLTQNHFTFSIDMFNQTVSSDGGCNVGDLWEPLKSEECSSLKRFSRRGLIDC